MKKANELSPSDKEISAFYSEMQKDKPEAEKEEKKEEVSSKRKGFLN